MLCLLSVDTALTGLERFGSLGSVAASQPAGQRREKTREVRGQSIAQNQETFWWWTQSVTN